MTCKRCSSNNIYRSRRNSYTDRLLSLCLIHPYRCKDCKSRSYAVSHDRLRQMKSLLERTHLQLFVYAVTLLSCLMVVYLIMREPTISGE